MNFTSLSSHPGSPRTQWGVLAFLWEDTRARQPQSSKMNEFLPHATRLRALHTGSHSVPQAGVSPATVLHTTGEDIGFLGGKLLAQGHTAGK